MPRIRAENLEAHQQAIWDALTHGLESLLSEKSYDEISIADIAAAAGIARNTFYNYASDKASLIAKTAAASAESLLLEITEIENAEGTPLHRLTRMIHAILAWFSSADQKHLVHCALFGAVAHSVGSIAGEPLLRIQKPVQHVVSEGILSGEFRPFSDIRFVVQMMAGAVHPAASRLLRAPDELETIQGQASAFLVSALQPELRK